MPRRQNLTDVGLRFLRGSRFDLGKKSFKGALPDPKVQIISLPSGAKLNEPESMIWWALTKLNIRFEPQYPLGPGRGLGGALLDFYLPDYQLDVDYFGPFHDSYEGRVKDFWRDATRQQYGITRVRMFEHELYTNGKADLRKCLWNVQKKVGAPVTVRADDNGG